MKEIDKNISDEVKAIIAKNNRVLTVLAHDLKSPIGSIVGFLSLIVDRMNSLDDSNIENNLYLALLSAKNAYSLLENLLEWAFAENSIERFKQEKVSLNDLIVETKESILFNAIHKKIDIEISSSEKMDVYVDRNMIKSVLRNIINNAIKFTHSKGLVIISVNQQNGTATISIKDNGIGIKKEKMEFLFSSFSHHLEKSTDNILGTGIGLLLCKEFINLHGGKIWVISEPGTGTEFKFSLPIFSN